MLEKIPSGLGHALRGLRAGFEKIVSEAPDFVDVPDILALQSDAFTDGGAIPPRYTANGEQISPPLLWTDVPAATAGLALIVEDPDAPSPEPFVHLLAWDLQPAFKMLPEGDLKSPRYEGLDETLGRNSCFRTAWLPPDPPRGHGPHHCVFQLFALDQRLRFEHPPKRQALVDAMRRHVLAKGVLVGTYERL